MKRNPKRQGWKSSHFCTLGDMGQKDGYGSTRWKDCCGAAESESSQGQRHPCFYNHILASDNLKYSLKNVMFSLMCQFNNLRYSMRLPEGWEESQGQDPREK